MNQHYPFELPPLPYPPTALCPFIDRRTLFFHHDRHFAAYVENLNKTLEPHPALHNKSLEWLLTHLNELPEGIRTPVRNNAGGVYAHDLYFRGMGKPCGAPPAGAFGNAIDRDFGSYAGYKKEMKEAAMGRFGSGWAWLTENAQGRLQIVSTPNQDVPPLNEQRPLLALDVWEHAYYLHYQNRRIDYIDAWFRLSKPS